MPFSFGVNVRTAASAREWCDKARRIEELGYATLTVPDHLAEMLAPIPAALSAADATTRLRVGVNVLNNDLRHPVLVAREAATADLLTGGRFQLGLGAGHMKAEYAQAGLTFERGATRVARLTEAVTIVKALLRGERVTFAGRYYRVTDHVIHPKPVQRSRPARHPASGRQHADRAQGRARGGARDRSGRWCRPPRRGQSRGHR